MKHSKKIFAGIVLTCCLFLVIPLIGQENAQAVEESVKEGNGFFTTFVRTPFVLFVFVGTLTGVMFSAFFEFIYNIFGGFDNGYPNTSMIWNLGWNELLDTWYWKPGVWWHVLISVIVWSPLLKRRKKED